MSIELYVEGGGDRRDRRAQCREAFRNLIERAGFTGRMPRIIACGSRNNAYDLFKTALLDGSAVAMLLVDSEEPVASAPWEHVQRHDGWTRPAGAADDHVQLMVTCMETWLLADRAALRTVFGSCLQESALLPITDLEDQRREEAQDSLARATRLCGKDRVYTKGRRSFQVLAEVNPNQIRVLPYFQRFLDALSRYA